MQSKKKKQEIFYYLTQHIEESMQFLLVSVEQERKSFQILVIF